MTEKERLAKNKRISQTKHETIERHKNMLIKTFDVKIQYNKLSKLQKEALETIFLEQKWYKNFILNWSEKSPENKITKFDIKIKNITKKDKNMKDVPITIKYLSAQSRQCLVSRMFSNIKTLHTLKIKNYQKPGKLKYSKEEKIIDLKQYGTSHKIISSKRVKLAGLPKTFIVNGLKQFINIPGIEFANARLLHRGTGYFVQFVTYSPNNNIKQEKINKTIGIDFGCSTSFTTSEREKILIKIPESERLKKLQKQQAKKVKGSKNFLRKVKQVQKEYQKITNHKNDIANKIVSKFKQYQTIVIQDEQLQNWHKSGHGKAIQHSILGRVKSRLKNLDNVVLLRKTAPTTKLCRNCGIWHDELKPWDKTFQCECGIKEDRDIHAAQNMVWMYKNNIGLKETIKVGREPTKVKRLEMKALVDEVIASEHQLLSVKDEASTL